MNKRLLIIKACTDVCGAEIDHLKSVAVIIGMDHCDCELKSIDEFKKQICAKGEKYDYIYLAAHAGRESFGEEEESVSIKWDDFALALCEIDCLNQECILLLACCRGGLNGVANTLFDNCTQIDYVCGPRWTVTGPDITAGFHVFIYNMEFRKEQPSTAVCRASNATGYDFFCYDRVEIEDQYISV
jgi:hypothetical protein